MKERIIYLPYFSVFILMLGIFIGDYFEYNLKYIIFPVAFLIGTMISHIILLVKENGK